MKNKKWAITIILLILISIYSIVSILTDALCEYKTLNFILLLVLFAIGLLLLKESLNLGIISFNSKDKLYKSLIKNSDTIYIMINSKSKNIEYISKNVEDILGIKYEEDSVAYKVINLPVVKNEFDKWDKISNYVSGMIKYDNPKYNSDMWIRIKIFPYKDKKDEYYIIHIVDATKEHDRQHLLISQATNIKSRENTLNQITEKSYDFEISVNLIHNYYDLRYFKKDKLYFGEEKRGIYTEELKKFLNYINESDRQLVYSNLNIESLKEHFNKYELDSITFRYRIGNEVKNNTWLESTIFFITDKNQKSVSILTKNVTESAESIRQQNVMLQNALNEARRVSKSKTDLISTISHDIRVPLTNIVGLSESLLEENISDNIKDDIKNIKSSSKDMLNIIEELLDTSKIEKKLIEKNEKNYSILKMFKKIESIAKEYIGDKQVKLNINLDSNLPIILYGDYIRITQAINEIVNNSIKYTNEGLIDINVKGEKIQNSVKLSVEVKDTGNGIEEQKLNSIMNDENNKGITAVKNLMNLLDGKLEIESKENEYTKVTITYMQKIVEDNKVRELINSDKTAEKFSLKGKKVLVVDDNELNLKVTDRLLKSYDLDVVLLQSGEECIEYIKEQNDFDLILMDQMMPGLDGTSTMNKLKEIENFNTPIVVLTADAMQGQKEKYLSSGFNDYISKPIDKSELARILKKFIKNQ